MNRKGFTLIELLAIIVILAIIAVITVPLILGIIDDAKKGAAKDSAYGYKKAVEQFIYSMKLADSEYYVVNGEYEISIFKNQGLLVNGKEPSDGWVMIVDSKVTDYSLIFGDYVVTYDSGANTVEVVKGNQLALTPNMQIKMNAKEAALAIVSEKTGTTSLFDITEGWVAFIDGELKAYSVCVTVSDKVFIVTDNNIAYENNEITSNNAVAQEGTEVADKINAKQLIVSYKVDTYVKAALSSNSSLTDETAKTVSEMSGVTTNQADSGWIHFNKINNSVVVVDFSLTYGDLTANYSSLTDSSYVSTFGASRNKPVILIGTIRGDGAKYLETVREIYYNPTLGTVCNSSDAVSTHGVTEGCLKWYLYSVKGDYANMLLDHNINPTGTGVIWASKSDYEYGQTPVYDTDGVTVLGYTSGTKAASLGISYPSSVEYFPEYVGSGKNAKGPLSLLAFLKTSTSSWTTSVRGDFSTYTANTEYAKFTIDYSGYKARLISAQEVANIKGATFNESTRGDQLSLIPSWLYVNTENSKGKHGYWVSSPHGVNSGYGWRVHRSGILDSNYVNQNFMGLRPVITVLVSDVL